jgi:hypothetical protein
LSDDTGILQHASFSVPNREHGYCTDDNARALIVALLGQQLGEAAQTLTPLAYRYLGFLQHAFNAEAGRFRNFMSFDRRWLEDVGSDDSHGRAMWGLGHAIAHATERGMVGAATRLFDRALAGAVELASPRSQAFSLVGIDGYLRRFPGAREVQRARTTLANRIATTWREHATAEWPWLEDEVTYANGIIPQALILAGSGLDDADMVRIGLTSLRWLMQAQTDPAGHFTPIGNGGWMTRAGPRARFDQQPIEAQHMVDALLTAYKLTRERRWLDDARMCFDWFMGRNDLQQPVADPATGGCGDGLSAERVNPNQGAESTLAWLHALAQIRAVAEKRMQTRRPETRLTLMPSPTEHSIGAAH